MITLLLGLAIFFGVHTVPMFRNVRASLVARLGEPRFQGIYAVFALTGFALIMLGTSRADFVPVWTPPAWSRLLANLVMPIAFCLFLAAFIPNNFRRVIRHPMLTGVALWAVSHLLANGDLASILLFASFGTFAIVDMISVNRRGPAEVPEKKPLSADLRVLGLGLVAFWIVRHYHVALFGVSGMPAP